VTDATGDDRPEFRPWRDGGDPLDQKRRALFARAAPVFRRYGFRGSTIKALAHACGLRPASLYHYFRSKEEMATYIVRRPRMDWDGVWVDPSVDPLVQLRSLVDLALAELPDYLLALRLSDEIAGSTEDGRHAGVFREGESLFGRLLVATAPAMARADAERVARDALSAMIGSAVVGLDPEPHADVRERVVATLRMALVPVHVEGVRFDDALATRRQAE
jgi:AcrR family transcriptional regulator